MEQTSDFSTLAGEFSRLWLLVYERATETRRELLTEPYFVAMANLSDTFAIVLHRPDGTVAAFGLLLEDRPWLHFLQCGFSAEAGRAESAYLRLLIEVIRAGIKADFRWLNLGCTTLAPKLKLGAVPIPLSAWLHHQNPLLNAGLRIVARRSGAAALPASMRVFT